MLSPYPVAPSIRAHWTCVSIDTVVLAVEAKPRGRLGADQMVVLRFL